MKNISITLGILLGILILNSCNGPKEPKNSIESIDDLADLRDSFSFAAGFNYGLQLKDRFITDINFEALNAGMQEAFNKDSGFVITPELYESIVAEFLSNIEERISAENIDASNQLIERVSQDPEVQKSEGGIYWKVIQEGSGPTVTISDSVVLHLKVNLADGRLFEDTKEYGEPLVIPVQGAWPGMVEGLQLMRKGSIYEFYVPYNKGFGKKPRLRGLPPNAPLIYYIELIDIVY